MEYSPEAFQRLADSIVDNLKALGAKNVQVGIPGDSGGRDGATNAQIGYYHERGAPDSGLPARPFLVPGVTDAQPKVAAILEKTAKKAVTGDADIGAALEAVGLVAVSSVRKKFDDNQWEPLADSTVKARVRRQGAKGGNKQYKEHYKKYKASGDLNEVRGDLQILVDTGAMRQAITHVIDGKEIDTNV